MSLGVIVGITLACALLIILAILIVVTMVCRRRHRRSRASQEPLGLQNLVVRYFSSEPEVDDGGVPHPGQGPPPDYTPSEPSLASNGTATVTVSITYPSYEAPPSYDIAIVSRPRAPSYTDEDAPSYAESQGLPVSLNPEGRKHRSRNKEGQGQRSRDSSQDSVSTGDISLTGHGAMGDLGMVMGSSSRRQSFDSQRSLQGHSTA